MSHSPANVDYVHPAGQGQLTNGPIEYINQKVINEVKNFFLHNHGESVWFAVKAILTRHFKLISEASYSAEKYRGMIKDKDLEHLAAFKDLKFNDEFEF